MEQVILVKFISLPMPYDQFGGKSMWLGDPFDISEIATQTDSFSADLQGRKTAVHHADSSRVA